MSNSEKPAQGSLNSRAMTPTPSLSKSSPHHSQSIPTCPHLQDRGAAGVTSPTFCPQCVAPLSSSPSDFGSSQPRTLNPGNTPPNHHGRALNVNNSYQTDNAGRPSSTASSIQYPRGSQSDISSQRPSSVAMDRSAPTYRSLDAWAAAPITEEPWTALRVTGKYQTRDGRVGEGLEEYRKNASEDQQEDSVSPN